MDVQINKLKKNVCFYLYIHFWNKILVECKWDRLTSNIYFSYKQKTLIFCSVGVNNVNCLSNWNYIYSKSRIVSVNDITLTVKVLLKRLLVEIVKDNYVWQLLTKSSLACSITQFVLLFISKCVSYVTNFFNTNTLANITRIQPFQESLRKFNLFLDGWWLCKSSVKISQC